MLNVQDTIISQYTHSPVLLKIIQELDNAIDPKHDIELFYQKIWKIETASGYGLDVWGRIVGIGRYIKAVAENENFGFTDGTTPFNSGVWYVGEAGERLFKLNDDIYRRIIMIKAMSNIIYATAPFINQLLRALFGERGRAYFVKNDTMAARYVFEFTLLPLERAVIRQNDILPRPSGVLLDWFEPEINDTFGFADTELKPFGQGVFFN
ncbi:DUF2612 domain-containing protein [Wielerella bovis]|uniref:DUF2612 domain-containing protein n=1 Tax=Wielerella bovis TaxID=2917790 RepID=UPI00201A1CFA|nr:DUF2612 domain-containing protein [Wielerella bovis]ULJ66160.1 DUF2612 domain-containing protein [Wielerella bovis]